ncbi:OPT-domain-containing protein [Meredithblackwellia eburnea MCA 4105]
MGREREPLPTETPTCIALKQTPSFLRLDDNAEEHLLSPRTPWSSRGPFTAGIDLEESWPPPTPAAKRFHNHDHGDKKGEGPRESDFETLNEDEKLLDGVDQEEDSTSQPTDGLSTRVVVIGSVLGALGAYVGAVMNFKLSAPPFSPVVPILAARSMVALAQKILPSISTVSEHELTILSIIATAASSFPYGGHPISVLSIYYKQTLEPLNCFLFLLSTSLALIDEPWPTAQVTATFIRSTKPSSVTSFCEPSPSHSPKVFAFPFLGTLLYQSIPSFIFPMLVSVAPLCLALPASHTLAAFGSGYRGFGFTSFSLDWTAVGASSPLVVSAASSLSYLGGMASMSWIISPCLWAGNIWQIREFSSPIDPHLFGKDYKRVSMDLTNVVDKNLLLTPCSALGYAASFSVFHQQAWIAGNLTWIGNDEKDGGLGINFVQLLLAVVLASLLVVPCGFVAATSGVTLGANIISQVFAGLVWQNEGKVNMLFKTHVHAAVSQLCADLKLAKLTNTSTRSAFFGRCIGSVVGVTVTHFTLHHIIESKRLFLESTVASAQWTGRSTELFGTASLIFGEIGPLRFFSGMYWILWLGFPLGAIAPPLVRFAGWLFPTSFKPLSLVDPTRISAAGGAERPTSVILPTLAVVVAHMCRKSWFSMLQLLAAALDSATSIVALLAFLLPMRPLLPSWLTFDPDNPKAPPHFLGSLSFAAASMVTETLITHGQTFTMTYEPSATQGSSTSVESLNETASFKSEHDSLTSGEIATAVVSGVLGTALIVIPFLYWCFRQTRKMRLESSRQRADREEDRLEPLLEVPAITNDKLTPKFDMGYGDSKDEFPVVEAKAQTQPQANPLARSIPATVLLAPKRRDSKLFGPRDLK